VADLLHHDVDVEGGGGGTVDLGAQLVAPLQVRARGAMSGRDPAADHRYTARSPPRLQRG
jgi:hypothetical protein